MVYHPCETVVPDDEHMLNFDLEFGSGTARETVLCLDNYGNDVMGSKFHKRLMGGLRISDYLLGINRKTGEVYRVTFSHQLDQLQATVVPLVDTVTIRLPKPWLKKIDQLKTKKRPWAVTLQDTVMFQLQSRDYGFSDLDQMLLVVLDFGDYNLEIGSAMYRSVGDWTGS